MKICIDFGGKTDMHYKTIIYDGLLELSKIRGFTVSEITDGDIIPELKGTMRIYIDSQLIAFIDYSDFVEHPMIKKIRDNIDNINAYCIFKYQYEDGYDYGINNVIAAGYHTSLYKLDYTTPKKIQDRNIDVISRMRTHQHHKDRKNLQWSINRKRVCDIADSLNTEGFNCKTKKVSIEQYVNELKNSKIGYNWRGVGFLNFKMIEYFKYGVVMMTDPYNDKHPIKENLYLEDNINCVVCDNPNDFYKETKILLKDVKKMNRIQKNAHEQWIEELKPDRIANFYLDKMMELINTDNKLKL